MPDRLREMREHVGVDPHAIVDGKQVASRADRRLAARVVREQQRKSRTIPVPPESEGKK